MYNESPPTNSGRDRAIETLIDMEPHGAFYRAARALDEAVPFALLNRPNLVTRAALVEQANALSKYEIDSAQAYSKSMTSPEKLTCCVKPDNVNQDGVLKHFAKILKIQQHKSTAASSQLVASLGRIYGKDSEALLKHVMGHEALKADAAAALPKQTEEQTEEQEEEEEDELKSTASLECIVGNACKLVVSEDKKSSAALDGLLIAVLTILTGCMVTDDEQDEEQNPNPKLGRKAASKPSRVDTLKPNMPALQVGGVLSLLATVKDDDKNTFSLDPKLMAYLGKAASVYEERIEIQKERVLARMQAEAAEKDAEPEIPFAPVTPPSARVVSSGEEETPSGDNDEGVATPVQQQEASNDGDGAAAEAAHVSDNDDDDDDDSADDEQAAEEALRRLVAAGGASDVSEDDARLSLLGDEEALRRLEAAVGIRPDNDSSDEDGDDHYHQLDDAPDSENPQADGVGEEGVEIHREHDDADDDDSSSYSSGHDDDDDVVDGEDEEDIDDVDSEDEEDDMLRQALALSLAEHARAEATHAAEETADAAILNDEEEGEEQGGSDEAPSAESVKDASDKEPSNNDDVLETKGSAKDDTDESLPSLPDPPSKYPFQSWLRSAGTMEDADFRPLQHVARAGSDEVPNNPYLDPSALSSFGTMPVAHVVVNLLQNALLTLQDENGKEGDMADKGSSKDRSWYNSVPGGVGSSLFVPLTHDVEASKEEEKGDAPSDSKASTQLLVSALILFSEQRDLAIESLRQAILLEHQNTVDDDLEEELKEQDDGGRTPTSDEEDDPAMALAMNYASASASDSLETKGMTRKAKAKRHDAAVLLKSLQKRTAAWKQRVELYSQCTLLVMKCLRTLLQSITRKWLDSKSHPGDDFLSLGERADSISSTARAKLSETLNVLMSTTTYRSFSALFPRDNVDEVEELFLPLQLYREAVLLWGECIPLLYLTPKSRFGLVSTLIGKKYPESEEEFLAFEALDGLKTLPSSEWHSNLHRLRLLSQRLCVSDLLDTFVSRPILYDPDESEEAHEIAKLREERGKASREPDPDRASNVVAKIGVACAKLGICEGGDLRQLYLALCHKCNVRTILWDGFLASNGDTSEDRLSSSVASASASSGSILRVSANPSSSLQFDSSKCSDSIAVLSTSAASSNGPSAHQRASKVWGTVLSSTCFSPKTGVHRWAVRLDKCERGHVFVGVSTSQASMRTYVGGDKYGWGVIGTQALWHDRRKIRGDYGATFRTGSTIVVTLDTDAGTVSYSSWKDGSNSSAAFSVDALIPSASSPSRRHAAGGGGIVEDWGVAFEGLPLDSRLYPAVGLYQRDDRVTLLTVESGGQPSLLRDGVGGMVGGGACFYPRNLLTVGRGIDGVSHHRRMVQVRRHNDLLAWDGVQYVTDMLDRALQSLQSPAGPDNVILTSVLPSIAASICLMPPSIPVLSARSALALLPQLNQCIHAIDSLVVSQQKQNKILFHEGLKDGEWTIRATGYSGTEASNEHEECVVNFSKVEKGGIVIGFQGTGVGTTGKSKNGLVSIKGTVCGSALSFVEEWKDAATGSPDEADDSPSSCVISARLSLDGCKFEGSYRNVQYSTTGRIAGVLGSEEGKAPGAVLPERTNKANHEPLLSCEVLLCLAHGHLAGLLGSDVSGNHTNGTDSTRPEGYSESDWKEKCSALKRIVLRPLFSRGPADLDSNSIMESLRRCYSFPLHGGAAVDRGEYRALDALDATLSSVHMKKSPRNALPSLTNVVELLDDEVTTLAGGKGSLHPICPSEYTASRRQLIAAMVYHSNSHELLMRHCKEKNTRESVGDVVIALWRGALRIMEDGLRSIMAASSKRSKREVAIAFCKMTNRKSSFLYLLRPCPNTLPAADLVNEFSSFYSTVECESDLDYIEEEVDCAVRRAVLRMVSLQEMKSLLSTDNRSLQKCVQSVVAQECCVAALPRLLGRGLAEEVVITAADRSSLSNTDLGGYYLTHLSAAGDIAEDVQRTCRGLFQDIAELLRRGLNLNRGGASSTIASSSNSLNLAILASFTTTIRSSDVEDIVLESKIIDYVSDIIRLNRPAVGNNQVKVEEDDKANDDAIRVCYQAVGRDVSRAVLRASVSVLHVISFQLARQLSLTGEAFSETGTIALRRCVKLLHEEIQQTMPFIRSLVADQIEEYQRKQRDRQWERWCDVCPSNSERPSAKSRIKLRKKGDKAGVLYLVEQGDFPIPPGVSTSPQKLSSRINTVSPSSSVPVERMQLKLGASCHQFISQLLHIFSAMVKLPSSLSVLHKSNEWAPVLLRAIGLKSNLDGIHLNGSGFVSKLEGVYKVPARYRIRILRLLLPVLSPYKPNETLVSGFFSLVGLSSISDDSEGSRDDEDSVPQEIVSLLRHLYNGPFGAWRQAIHRIIDEGFASPIGERELSHLQLGMLAFLSGSMGTVSRGSFVLLKPAAALSVSADTQSSGSSKSHSGSGSGPSASGAMPHHVVGNGTEGVIAGLCRFDASAGMVSSVDVKNGTCEVVLTTRYQIPSFGAHTLSQSPLRARPVETSDRAGSSGRSTMTVRALRAPLSDVVHAEEVPLLLGTSVPTANLLGSLLSSSLHSLSVALTEREVIALEKEEDGECKPSEHREDRREAKSTSADNVFRLSGSLMALRAATTVLADEEQISSFLKSSLSKEILFIALKVATGGQHSNATLPKVLDSARFENLSYLPSHEAKFRYLLSMLRELSFRQNALDSSPISYWEERLADDGAKEGGNVDTVPPEDSASSMTGGYSTPPATTGSTTGVSSLRDTSTAGDESDQGSSDRVNEPSSQRSSRPSGSNSAEDEDEADSTAAAHLREAAIAQMAELGLPRPWSELALRRTGGTNIEAAVHFCLERGGEMDRLLAEERERERMVQRETSGTRGARRRGATESSGSNQQLRQLLEMGFPSRWCSEALAATHNNVDEALTWILTNGERLSAEDEGMGEDEDDDEDVDSESGDDDSDTHSAGDAEATRSSAEHDTSDGVQAAAESALTPGNASEPEPSKGTAPTSWSGSVTPLRFISGRSIINPETLEVSGLPSGGFSSVGTKGVMLTSGKWYYEAILESAGCLQIGWADGSFSGHCNADRGDGCGDGPSSWAYDGWRRYRWHACATEWGCRWKEGDVVGCLVDMDKHIVSFTLNGRGEEIGMGEAFSGRGFRPCGGVYACVSFNRREKLRLILGGEGSEPFKHEPPSGYRGVGEAVLEAVGELDVLLSKEAILDEDGLQESTSQSVVPATKKFLCDFSDGEHGHELFAWQHRYYGSDASVHLGSGRTKHSGGSLKHSVGDGVGLKSAAAADVSRRVEKEWSNLRAGDPNVGEKDDAAAVVAKLKQGYENVTEQVKEELLNECLAIGILYARKFILHLMVSTGSAFDLKYFVAPKSSQKGEKAELQVARQLWKMLDACVSLRSNGWVGEAGAMAVAAEALGLGISSNDHQHHVRHKPSDRGRTVSKSVGKSDEIIAGGGITQFLSSTLLLDISSHQDVRGASSSLVACAEASLGSGGGGGSLVFLQQGLQSAVCKSAALRNILIAVIRRSVRLLAVVSYAGNESTTDDVDDDDIIDGMDSAFEKASGSFRDDLEEEGDQDESMHSDARLVCFLTGLLMSKPVLGSLADPSSIMVPLFESWSVGLLSASSPWRMVCALSAAGILNECPCALPHAIGSNATLARYFNRLEITVARRVWAERAASPVCSRFLQSMVELLASVERSHRLLLPAPRTSRTLSVDAATPIPLEASPGSVLRTRSGHSTPHKKMPPSWEWDQGWVACDEGWELWSGTVECMAVEWKTPSRSAVRTLMDGGDGPPFLSEGCQVVRGLDWDDTENGSEKRTDDGKDKYDEEKKQREKEKKELEEQQTVQEDPAVGDEAETADSTKEKQSDNATDPVAEDMQNESEPSQSSLPASSTEDKTQQRKEAPPASTVSSGEKKKKRKKIPSPKLPVGTVLSIEPWKGIPAMARRVRWHLTGVEGVYRFGGDGGKYDLCHVEINDKATRIKKRHPLPESSEQCAARHGFGVARKYSVLLRLRRDGCRRPVVDDDDDFFHEGILEWPDFGAGIRVDCILHSDGAVTVTERELLFGSKDSGWEARFGQPSYVPGTVIVLNPTESSSQRNQSELDANSAFLSSYEELLGSSSFTVADLRNRADGGKLRVTSEMKLLRARRTSASCEEEESAPRDTIQAPMPPPITFDRNFKASSLSVSRDGRTVSCLSHDGRCTAFGAVGFTKGVHYWEVKLEQADIGSVFIGVAEKPGAGGTGGYSYGDQPRLNRWQGWGFVNFRATYSAGAERVYGAHCHNSDTVGVLLDCDAGRVSFFCDQLKYGEHILNDLGCAFENLSPFGFNADGCGTGGAGQGAPSGIEGGRGARYPAQGSVRPRSLWPVVGLRTPGDRVTISSKWMSSYGVDGATTLKNILAVDEILCAYDTSRETAVRASIDQRALHATDKQTATSEILPNWFVEEAFVEYERWREGRWYRSRTRCSGPHRLASFGLDVDLDTSPLACASACASLGLSYALLAGDRVRVKRSAGRLLELAEEALVLGAYQGRLFYRIVAQKSEGGSLTEGGGRAWFWDESEVVDDGLQLIGPGRGLGLELPLLDRFKCTSPGGLKVVYEKGAVVRPDLEILDGAPSIGSIPVGTVIPKKDVLERRVNSCGVVRYKIYFEAVGRGWISARIRGGDEESIVVPVSSHDTSTGAPERTYQIPRDSAVAWYEAYAVESKSKDHPKDALKMDNQWKIMDVDEFQSLLSQGKIAGLTSFQSDEKLAAAVSAIADFSEFGDPVDCCFKDVVGAVSFAVDSKSGRIQSTSSVPAANQAAAAAFSTVNTKLPPAKALLARIAVLRALNRRTRLALPWLSMRPGQEGSAIFGGLCGHGASIERVGRNMNTDASETWCRPSSVASRVRNSRRLIFGSVKRLLLDSITDATTTPTPLSHDEYELPREIRTVRINRLKAIRAMAGDDNAAKRKHAVFFQLQNETKSWGGAALRRGYVAKGHGGQKRAFKLKLIGEGVNDYSGPYREAFTDAAMELTALDSNNHGALGVLEPTPNNASDVGDHRELFMFALADAVAKHQNRNNAVSPEELRIRESFSSLTTARDESSRELEEALVFLGRMSGTACRHGIPLDLPLPLGTVWRVLCEEKSEYADRLQELDVIGRRQLDGLDGKSAKTPLLWWQQRMLNSLVEGMSNVLPVEIFPVFTGEELRDIICGNPEVDVDLLRRVVEYEGYEDTDDVIEHFWEVLQEMSTAERKSFLQFVWARSRLPMKESDFDAPFKIMRDSASDGDNCDVALPSASTCFFSLTLPNYSTKEILRQKLQFAIENVCTMESDYVTNAAEVGEGWRGL